LPIPYVMPFLVRFLVPSIELVIGFYVARR